MPVEVKWDIVLFSLFDDVWEVFIDVERLEEWFANEVEFEFRSGGEGFFRWDIGEERRAHVEVVEEPFRFEFEWAADGDEEASSVSFTLEEVPEGTRLTVVESAPVGMQACAGEWTWAFELQVLSVLARV